MTRHVVELTPAVADVHVGAVVITRPGRFSPGFSSGLFSHPRWYSYQVTRLFEHTIHARPLDGGSVVVLQRSRQASGDGGWFVLEPVQFDSLEQTSALSMRLLCRPDVLAAVGGGPARFAEAGVEGVLLEAQYGHPTLVLSGGHIVEVPFTRDTFCEVPAMARPDESLQFDTTPFDDERLARMILSRPWVTDATWGACWRPEHSICQFSGNHVGHDRRCPPRVTSRRGKRHELRQALTAEFGDLCQLCRKCPGDVLDHDHLTGMIRGLVCGECNTHLDRECCTDTACTWGSYLADPPAFRLGLRYPGGDLRHRRRKAELLRRLLESFPELERIRHVLEPRGWLDSPQS